MTMFSRSLRTGWIRILAATMLLVQVDRPEAIEVNGLYRATAIVTGQREETRKPGIKQCLRDVLVKVSGDPRLLREPELAKLGERAESFVHGFRYRDRLEGRPIRDEQGARDRPHDLTVDFEPAKIDEVLRSIGRSPWGAERPLVVAFVAVRFGPEAFVMSRDGERGLGQRAAIQAASERIGLPVVLPAHTVLSSAGLDGGPVSGSGFEWLEGLSKGMGSDPVLGGNMVFSEKELGWAADWHLLSGGRVYEWHIRGVNFDEAFRNALYGAAQVLSGHGQPD